MAKLLLVLILTVLSISAITEAQFTYRCPPNCQDSTCTSMGCVTCNSGYCLYYRNRIGICVRNCPAGMSCYHGAISICTRNRG